jgi:2-dehydropantoate 2-reductase
VKIAVLGPGGVGGLVAGALARERAPDASVVCGTGGGEEGAPAGARVVVLARDSTARVIEAEGLRVTSVVLGDFTARPRTISELEEPVDALIVATKADGLERGLSRVDAEPGVVLPLLNGLDHIVPLRERFPAEAVLAGSIRVEADRPSAGVVVHTSPFLLVSMATAHASAAAPMLALAGALDDAEVPVRVYEEISTRSEAEVMWSKLVRLNALACTTSAYDKLLGEIRSTPALRADLVGAMREAAAAGRAEGADVDGETAIEELERAHATLGSSMQRDIAAGREPELDAIPGSVMRAAARHGLACPTIERLVEMIAARAGIAPPVV